MRRLVRKLLAATPVQSSGVDTVAFVRSSARHLTAYCIATERVSDLLRRLFPDH